MVFKPILLLIFSFFVRLDAEVRDEANKVYFQAPDRPENAFLASYIEEGDLNKRFIISKAKKEDISEEIAKYDGEWKIAIPSTSAIEGDFALIMNSKAKHHAIATKLERPLQFNTKDVVIQYEVKFQNGMECGGAYIKLLSKIGDLDLSKFYDKTPFTIMFGPDKCGNDGKIHFIFRHQNPITKKFEEKMIKSPHKPNKIFDDKLTHLFTLVIHDNNRFEIYIDQTQVTSGSLLDDFDPPVNPPNEIPDPNDKKPVEWDDRPKIDDPTAKKPDDWDENAPEFITDVNAVKPDGWLDNEQPLIGDPEAKKPEDWDVEIDGVWEAPKIENPVCKAAPGCGEWNAPQIHNPAFKGKWGAPKIDNPAYKGEWKAKIIPNPDYFEDLNPFKMFEVYAMGLELWSMTDEVAFDNFLIVDSKEAADKWASQTWAIKHKAEVQANPSAQSVVDFVRDQMEERPAAVLAIVISSIFLFAVICYFLCCRSSSSEDSVSRHKKDDDYSAKPDDSDVDMDTKDQYEAAGPAANMAKSVCSKSESGSESESPSPSQAKGNQSEENAEEVDVEITKDTSKDTKIKRRSRKAE